MNDRVLIHEVGPRDGLQVEKAVVPREEKLRWIEGLFGSGIDIIQIGSFVNPEKVPQMADTDSLFSELTQSGKKPANVILSGLVLNEKGLDRGMACGVEMFCMGVSASETHSVKNTGMSPAEALSRIIPMAMKAQGAGQEGAGFRPVGIRLRLRRADRRGEGPRHREGVPRRRNQEHQPGRHGRPRPAAAGRGSFLRDPRARFPGRDGLPLPQHVRPRTRQLLRGPESRA